MPVTLPCWVVSTLLLFLWLRVYVLQCWVSLDAVISPTMEVELYGALDQRALRKVGPLAGGGLAVLVGRERGRRSLRNHGAQ